MAMTFEWDTLKAQSNLLKHVISFSEAATVFADLKSLTISDPHHSRTEERLITLGRSSGGHFLVVVHTERGRIYASLVAGKPIATKKRPMKKISSAQLASGDIQENYDFSKGVRGKYAPRYTKGTNLVLLAPDVAKAFPTSDSVNESLRALAGIISMHKTPAVARSSKRRLQASSS